MTKQDNELTYEYAKQYLSKGISFYPLLKGLKMPPKGIKWKRLQSEKPTQSEIEEWFLNLECTDLAIITGNISNIIIVDCDDQRSLDFWKNIGEEFHNDFYYLDTVQVSTKRGRHFYYRIPPKLPILDSFTRTRIQYIPSKNQFFSPYIKIDVKAEKGCSKAPPSFQDDGESKYQFIENKKQIRPMPEWLVNIVKKQEKEKYEKNQLIANQYRDKKEEDFFKSKKDGTKLLNKALQMSSTDGRNNMCFWMCRKLNDQGFPMENAKNLVYQFTQMANRKDHKFELNEALHCLYSAYSYTPRGGLDQKSQGNS